MHAGAQQRADGMIGKKNPLTGGPAQRGAQLTDGTQRRTGSCGNSV
jgi:hypothetical protein